MRVVRAELQPLVRVAPGSLDHPALVERVHQPHPVRLAPDVARDPMLDLQHRGHANLPDRRHGVLPLAEPLVLPERREELVPEGLELARHHGLGGRVLEAALGHDPRVRHGQRPLAGLVAALLLRADLADPQDRGRLREDLVREVGERSAAPARGLLRGGGAGVAGFPQGAASLLDLLLLCRRRPLVHLVGAAVHLPDVVQNPDASAARLLLPRRCGQHPHQRSAEAQAQGRRDRHRDKASPPQGVFRLGPSA
mmetsp:Transcript_4793/g.9918  ORF Transcript_4793/g.9918 Transcript_4793/m.9918 type:complete len:253 (+) Transcript_4793:689-1447(+)